MSSKFPAFLAQRDCCGLTEPDDWIRTSFYSQFNNSFPKSCCNSNDTPLRCGLGTFGEYADGFAALKTRVRNTNLEMDAAEVDNLTKVKTLNLLFFYKSFRGASLHSLKG